MCFYGTDKCSFSSFPTDAFSASLLPPAGEHPGHSSLSFYSADFSNCKYRRILLKNQFFSTFLIKTSPKMVQNVHNSRFGHRTFRTARLQHGRFKPFRVIYKRKLTVPTASGQSCQAPQGQWFPQFHGTRWRSRWRNAGKGD